MQGYRKFIVANAALILSTVAVGLGWIEGLQYASIVTLVVATYVGGNVAAKQKAQSQI